MTHVFKHPKFYRIPRDKEEARAQLKVPSSNSDQAISESTHDGESERAPGPGHKPQAPSSEGSSEDLRSSKLQASSFKLQAPSSESIKPQASSPKQQASSLKPQASSSMIREPRKSFTVLGPRASTMINVLCGWRVWKLIWCGENLILLPRVVFSSKVKKCPELL